MSVSLIMNTTAALQINVAQLLKEPIGSERSYKIAGRVDIDGSGTVPVEGSAEMTRTNRSILVKGRFSLNVDVSCARCLKQFILPLELEFEEEYFPLLDVGAAPMPEPEEPTSFTIDEYQVLDLTEAIRQYSVMAIPMKPLCRADCAGFKTQS
jgi:uncharacterized protein